MQWVRAGCLGIISLSNLDQHVSSRAWLLLYKHNQCNRLCGLPHNPFVLLPQIPTLFLVLFLKYHVPARKIARSVSQLFGKGIYGNFMKLFLLVQWKKTLVKSSAKKTEGPSSTLSHTLGLLCFKARAPAHPLGSRPAFWSARAVAT